MMNEVRVFGGLLLVLLVGAYMSWTHEDDGVDTSKVTIWDVPTAQLERVELVTTTETVAFSFRGEKEGRYGWFEVDRRQRRQVFVANDAADELLAKLAPFEALRSLGRNLSGDDFEETGLGEPKRKLTITAGGKTKVFDIGRRTHGARDHYVSPQTSEEVFLVAAKTLSDLERPDRRFMQRTVLVKPLGEVAGAQLAANGKTVDATHKNYKARAKAFWSVTGEDQPNEALGSFLLKLNRLTIREYPEDLTEFEKASPILEISWKDDAGRSIGTTSLYRSGEGDQATYFARSDRTVRPGVVSRPMAAQFEKDLATVLP